MSGLSQKDMEILTQYSQQGQRELYWNYLAHKEGNDGYGLLALGVVRNDNAPGATANIFAANHAKNHDGKVLSERQWDQFGQKLVSIDLEMRNRHMRENRPDLALNLPVDDVKQVHDRSFRGAGIDPNAWTPRELLEAAHRKGGDAEAEKVWNTMLDNGGMGLIRLSSTSANLVKYDDAQLNSFDYLTRMGAARMEATQALPNSSPDKIGAQNFHYLRDSKSGDWHSVANGGGGMPYMTKATDPKVINELNDTRALRLEQQERQKHGHPDDPYRNSMAKSPFVLADNGDATRQPESPETLIASRAANTPDQPGHPRHGLYQQCWDGVRQIDADLGRASDESSLRLAANLTSLAVENRFERVDHVLLSEKNEHVSQGQNVFIVQGDLKDPARHLAMTATENALTTPVEQSFQKVEQLDRNHPQQSLQATANLAQPQHETTPPQMRT